jgi:hypothetical protein
LQRLADYLDGPDSVVSKYTPSTLSRSAVIDVVTIRSSPFPHSFLSLFSRLTLSARTDSADRTKLELYDFPQPSIFQPHNYKRIYADNPSCSSPSFSSPPLPKSSSRCFFPFADHRGDGKAYEAYGISKEEGAIVVVRPDQCALLFPSASLSSRVLAHLACSSPPLSRSVILYSLPCFLHLLPSPNSRRRSHHLPLRLLHPRHLLLSIPPPRLRRWLPRFRNQEGPPARLDERREAGGREDFGS